MEEAKLSRPMRMSRLRRLRESTEMSRDGIGRLESDSMNGLERPAVVEIITTGNRSRLPRRVEVVAVPVGGHIYISGFPSRRKRAWVVNLEHDRRMTVRLPGDPPFEVAATGRVISDQTERRIILPQIQNVFPALRRHDVDVLVSWSPLIEVLLEDSLQR